MKKAAYLLIFLFVQHAFSCNCLTYSEAKKKALKENKFIIAHFNNSFYTDSNRNGKFYFNELSIEQNKIFENFIYWCVPNNNYIDNDLYYKKYNVTKSPSILIIDPKGVEVYRITFKESDSDFQNVFTNFSQMSISHKENFKVKNNFNTLVTVAENYFDYTINLSKTSKSQLFNTIDNYLFEAEEILKNNDKDYIEKKQKIDLLKLYRFAYNSNFDILNDKLNTIDVNSIKNNNVKSYYFLKYIALKAMKNNDLLLVEAKLKTFSEFKELKRISDILLTNY